MRNLLPTILFCMTTVGAPLAAHAAVMDSVNESATPYNGTVWNATDIGWFYTPSFSYILKGINTKFSSSRSIVTEAVYSDVPVRGGTLLRSATFAAVENTFSGGLFDDLELKAGTQYFFGFTDVGGMGLNVTTDAGATGLVAGMQYSFGERLDRATFHMAGPHMGRDAQPIIQFIGDYIPQTNNVPEPATTALLGLGLLGFALSRRKSI